MNDAFWPMFSNRAKNPKKEKERNRCFFFLLPRMTSVMMLHLSHNSNSHWLGKSRFLQHRILSSRVSKFSPAARLFHSELQQDAEDSLVMQIPNSTQQKGHMLLTNATIKAIVVRLVCDFNRRYFWECHKNSLLSF